MSVMIEERIAELATCQHGLVTRGQLVEAGLSDRAVDRRVEAKRLRAVHRGVYLVGPLEPPRAREMAAVLACGTPAAVSHASAAWLWEAVARPSDASPVDVRVPGHVRIRRPGIRAHRTMPFDPAEVTTVGGIPLTTPGRTLVDLARDLSARELERAVARVERRNLVSRPELVTLTERYRGRPGITNLTRVIGIEGGAAFTRSALEDRFVDEVRRFGLPVPRFNTTAAGHELDCYWPAARMAVELDGAAYHASWQSQENDRRRDRDLAAAGIAVVRVTWSQLTDDTDRTMMRLGQALAIHLDRLGRGPGA